MCSDHDLRTAYALPFAVEYAGSRMFSTGGSLQGVIRAGRAPRAGSHNLQATLDLFVRLASTGALSGKEVPPGSSGVWLGDPILAAQSHSAFYLRDCFVSPRALVTLAHLLLGREHEIRTEVLQVFPRGEYPAEALLSDPRRPSSYPERYSDLPFAFVDEGPEGGGYTFTAQLQHPLNREYGEVLSAALLTWTEAVQAGAYGLAPIPPDECYAEPQDRSVVSFETTVEWTVYKVRADPACIDGVVNIFAAFHERCQPILDLSIT